MLIKPNLLVVDARGHLRGQYEYFIYFATTFDVVVTTVTILGGVITVPPKQEACSRYRWTSEDMSLPSMHCLGSGLQSPVHDLWDGQGLCVSDRFAIL